MNDGPNFLGFLVPGFATLSLFKWVASKLGCHEAALRLIFSLLLGYPVCALYNLFLVRKTLLTKQIYFLVCGLSIGFFNYGINILHTFVTILTIHILLTLLGGKHITVVLTVIFCTSYLLWGYYMTQSEEYAFEWTIPQCVVTLRLIAVAFDVFDGHRPVPGKNDKQQPGRDTIVNEDALHKPPTLLQLLSHSYFPASFLVGPQYGLKRYLNYIDVTESFLPISLGPALKNLTLGLLYLAIFQMGSLWWPYQYLTSTDFQELGFWYKLSVIALITKIQLCKYISIWLLSEGCCIISGVTYDKQLESFDSCTNVNVLEFEISPTFGGLIRAFNVTTNLWAAKYIFRRMRFLGSKFLSHVCTLFYLALWHGWKSGYYVTFSMEFLIMKTEWEVLALVNAKRRENPALDRFLSAFYVRWPLHVLFRIYTVFMFGYCLVPFLLLSYQKWIPVLSQIYFVGHLIYFPWLLISLFIKT